MILYLTIIILILFDLRYWLKRFSLLICLWKETLKYQDTWMILIWQTSSPPKVKHHLKFFPHFRNVWDFISVDVNPGNVILKNLDTQELTLIETFVFFNITSLNLEKKNNSSVHILSVFFCVKPEWFKQVSYCQMYICDTKLIAYIVYIKLAYQFSVCILGFQTVTEEKTFTGGLSVNSTVKVSGTVDDIDLSQDVVTLTGWIILKVFINYPLSFPWENDYSFIIVRLVQVPSKLQYGWSRWAPKTMSGNMVILTSEKAVML